MVFHCYHWINQSQANNLEAKQTGFFFLIIIPLIIPFLMFYRIQPNYSIFPSMWDINKAVIKSRVDEQSWLFAWNPLLL